MSAKEVDYLKSLFFETCKVIENMHKEGDWFCFSYRCQDCQTLKDFLKRQKKILFNMTISGKV